MPTFASVDDYIAAQPNGVAQERLRELRALLRASAPGAVEGLGYGIPADRFKGAAVYFGAAKRHVALYGAPMEAFVEELNAFDTSKGTVRFALDQPLPADLVRRLVVATVAGREAARKR